MNLPEEISLDPIVADLRDADPAVRAQAATILGLARNPMVVEYLMQVLAFDTDLHVKRSVAIALGNIGHPSGIQPLLLAIQSSDPELRTFAAEALGKIPSPDVVELLIIALQGDVRIKIGALEALGRIGDVRAVSHIQKLGPQVHAELDTVRCMALAKLGAGGPAELETISRRMDTLTAHGRSIALDALVALGQEAWPQIATCLSDEDPIVRAQAARLLGSLQVPASLPRLMEAIEDPDPMVRASALEGISFHGTDQAREGLRTLMSRVDAGDPVRPEVEEILSRLAMVADAGVEAASLEGLSQG
ncbi:MAG: HEAT repeat domain-containing protein [bacterium]|nr:HEAT repeat domain-containing protein [bacterium]